MLLQAQQPLAYSCSRSPWPGELALRRVFPGSLPLLQSELHVCAETTYLVCGDESLLILAVVEHALVAIANLKTCRWNLVRTK